MSALLSWEGGVGLSFFFKFSLTALSPWSCRLFKFTLVTIGSCVETGVWSIYGELSVEELSRFCFFCFFFFVFSLSSASPEKMVECCLKPEKIKERCRFFFPFFFFLFIFFCRGTYYLKGSFQLFVIWRRGSRCLCCFLVCSDDVGVGLSVSIGWFSWSVDVGCLEDVDLPPFLRRTPLVPSFCAVTFQGLFRGCNRCGRRSRQVLGLVPSFLRAMLRQMSLFLTHPAVRLPSLDDNPHLPVVVGNYAGNGVNLIFLIPMYSGWSLKCFVVIFPYASFFGSFCRW